MINILDSFIELGSNYDV